MAKRTIRKNTTVSEETERKIKLLKSKGISFADVAEWGVEQYFEKMGLAGEALPPLEYGENQ